MSPQPPESNKCAICRRTFKRNEHLIRHLRTHTQERPFGCPLCEKKFTRQDTLKRHLLGHAEESNSSAPYDNLQVDQTDCKEIDQFIDRQSELVNWDLVEVGNLDWFDALATTTQPVCEDSLSPVQPAHAVRDRLASDTVFSAMIRPDSIISTQPGALDVARPKDGPVHRIGSGSLESANLDQPKELKLPPEMFNGMVDDYARRWLRELCNE